MIELLNIDCMEYMNECKDNQFDLAITDPPYFKEYGREIYPGSETSTTGVKRNRFESKHWDVPSENYFSELLRVSENQIIWGYNYYNINNISSGRIIWDKVNDSSSFSKAEIAYCSIHKSVQIFRFMWNGMLQGDMKNKEKRIHPTQKPVKLYEWLLLNYAKGVDKILDTHLGSGSIAIACDKMGFDLTACEIDKDYYDGAVKRLRLHQDQYKLFGD